MACRREKELIQKLLDGEIGPAEKARLDAHLEECEGCRTYMNQMAALGRFARSRKLEGRSEAYWRSYWPRLKPKLAEKRARRPLPVIRLLRNPAFELAAVVAVVLLVVIRFNMSVFESPALREGARETVAPLRGPEAYRHVLSSASRRRPAGPDDRLDRVVYPGRRSEYEYVLAPTRGVEGAARNGVIAI